MGAAGAPSFNWVRQVDDFFSAAGRSFPENHRFLDELSYPALDKLIEQAPKVLSAAQKRALLKLSTFDAHVDAVIAAGTNVDIRWFGVRVTMSSDLGVWVKRGLFKVDRESSSKRWQRRASRSPVTWRASWDGSSSPDRIVPMRGQ